MVLFGLEERELIAANPGMRPKDLALLLFKENDVVCTWILEAGLQVPR